jgi:hypothetical protein
MAKIVIECDATGGNTEVKCTDPKNYKTGPHLGMGKIKRIDHVTVIYHEANPTRQNCVTVWINGVPHRICS